MSIRLRLLFSYILMIIVPLCLISVVSVFIIKSYEGNYNLRIWQNSSMNVMEKSTSAFANLKYISEKKPEKLNTKYFWKDLEKNINIGDAGIIVTKNDNLFYASKLLNTNDIIKDLPKYGTVDEEQRNRPIIDNYLLIRQQDIRFSDKSSGSVYLIMNIGSRGKVFAQLAISISIALLIIFIVTDGFLTFYVSRSITKPIEELKKAANRIKDGNLNFEIKNHSKDEIGDLSIAFEAMRHKLKESVDVQLKYENNRKELISNISHDLKTPITAIKGYVEGIMDRVADNPAKIDKYIKTIYTKSNDLDRLIDELFLFSKLDLNKIPFNFENVNINDYLDDSYEELQFDLQEKGIILNYDSECERGTLVLADREKLKRVILNIVINSEKYMNKKNGNIKISLKNTDSKDFVLIRIEDNGKGISKGALPMIFDRFYRADPSRNTLTGGSGLGLAIAKRIIDEHGGKIWIESEEDIGTKIFFTLKKI